MNLLLLLGALAMSPAQARAEGPIQITFAALEDQTVYRVDVDGVIMVDGRRVHERLDFGPTSYRRIKALVAPVRRWAGGSAPCEAAEPASAPSLQNAWTAAPSEVARKPTAPR